MKKWLCLLLVFLLILPLVCACGSKSSQVETDEDKVRSKVNARLTFAYYGNAIGGNELKSSTGTISTITKVSDSKYKVSGKVEATDVYGTVWTNTFDCIVTKNTDGTWSAGALEYTNQSWSKK